jgi:hypothetical protein
VVLQAETVGDRISIAWTKPRKLLPNKLPSPNPMRDVAVVDTKQAGAGEGKSVQSTLQKASLSMASVSAGSKHGANHETCF